MASSIFKATRYSLGLMLCLTAASCGADDKSLKEFEKMCKTEYGTAIYEKVADDGYYDDQQCIDCDRDLIKSQYSYIEFCNLEKNRYSSVKDPGCWKISKIKAEEGRCDHYVNADNLKIAKKGEEPFKTFMSENCLLVERIEKPDAKYGYFSNLEKIWLDKKEGSLIRKSTIYIKNLYTNKVVARDISLSFTEHGADTGTATASKSCALKDAHGYEGIKDALFIKSVIIPLKSKN